MVDGNVLNTYVVIDPSGTIIGRSVKENAESYIFLRGKRANLIRTSFGLATVAICVDNHLTRTLHRVKQANPILHLMPHAWPIPDRTGPLVSNADMAKATQQFEEFPAKVARYLGAPTVFVNQVGDLPRMTGLYRYLMNPRSFALLGGSKILNGDGRVLAELGNEEGMAVADVPLAASPSEPRLTGFAGWTHPGPKIVRNVVTPVENWRGQRVYHRLLAQRDRDNSVDNSPPM